MLVSLKWLKDYIDIHLSAGEIADRLTMLGLEVDAVHEQRPEFSDIVVAKISSITPHPNADKCVLCQVTTGDAVHAIVCGADNIHVGDMVPLAKTGSKIPGGYAIKRSKIRGEWSDGMLCSEQELGIGDDASGIMILPDHLAAGTDLAEALDRTDTIFDIGITPNRSDCLSVIGIAREIAALTGEKIRYPDVNLQENGESPNRVASVEILDPDLCPRYTARVIKNVTIKPSPLWMRQRLEAAGMRSINNIVDITNFVMLEWGQPLHAFDFRFLEKGCIVVRRSREGERFTSLDGKERVLRPDTLMVCDGVKPVAIAGIMGGLNSEIQEDTDMILLESAYFQPSSVRQTAKWLGMNTDAAFRFGRGVDPEGILRASKRAAWLMEELAGGTVCKGYIDQYPLQVPPPPDITLRVKRLNDLLGTDIDIYEVSRHLKRIEMDVREIGKGRYRVMPPSFRVDITREIDLIEEVARLYGYDRVPVTFPEVSAVTATEDTSRSLKERVSGIMKGTGYSEVITYSFVSPESIDVLGLKEDDKRRCLVKIRNPLTEDHSVMRSTLVYSLLDVMRNNVHAGNSNLKIFETGNVFYHRQESELPEEKSQIAGLLSGVMADNLWAPKDVSADFYDLKGCVESIFDDLKLTDIRYDARHEETFLHPARSCGIYMQEQLVGFLGEVHPDVLEKMDLNVPVFVFEMDVDALAEGYSGKMVYRESPKFPSVKRDVAFLVSQSLEADKILRFGQDINKELLEKVSIFDVYMGKGISDGMKSVGLRFSYRASDRTLTDDEVNQIHHEIVQRMVDVTGAKIRG